MCINSKGYRLKYLTFQLTQSGNSLDPDRRKEEGMISSLLNDGLDLFVVCLQWLIILSPSRVLSVIAMKLGGWGLSLDICC